MASCVLSAAVALTGCFGNNDASTSSYSGTVSAPGGSIAFNPPTGLKKMFAEMFGGKYAHAAISGVSSVGAGVLIELIEVDADGNKVGSTIASTTTASDGSYTLAVPSTYDTNKTFAPGTKFVIRATGTAQSLDTRVTSTANDVDPVTDATSDLITEQYTDLTKITTDEVVTIKEAVDSIAQNIDPSGLTADGLSSALKTEALADEEVLNQITSAAAAGKICGNVKDSADNNLENILIIVRDYSNWVTRNKIKTDSSGDFCVNVPDGEYILGALNFTGTSTAASEWWHSSGTKYSQIDAEKITVAANTVTKNFSLEAGARLTGTVKTTGAGSLAAGTALEGVKVLVRQYQNFFPVAGKKTKADGTYRVNVIPGSYMIVARNKTTNAYGSEIYDGSTGTNHRFGASKVTLTAGTTTTIDFDLAKGYKVSGQILDNTGGNAVTGERIRIDSTASGGGPAFRLRSNKEGKYRIWLPPSTYRVRTYGQDSGSLDLTASNKTQDFTAQVGTVTATLKNAAGTGISQAKVWVTDTSGNFVHNEISNSDGTVELHSNTSGNHLMYVRIDDDHGTDTVANNRYGSVVYSGATSTEKVLLNGTQIGVTVGSTTALGDITLPDAGLLVVNVTSDGSTPTAEYKVQVRSGSNTSAEQLLTHRTLGDGALKLSLPAGTYGLRMTSDSTTCASVSITAGSTTTVNFRTDTDTCS